MAKKKAETAQQTHGAGVEDVDQAQAERAGAEYEWHFGRITRMGHSAMAGSGVTIVWEEGGVTSQQGDITEEQWEIFKLAFVTTGRVAILSDQEGEDWMYDYRFVEAVR